MAQTTPNFGFNIAEGTDTVNLLTQCYPNFTSLDSILQGIKETGVTTAVATKTGTNFAVVRTDTDCNFFRFIATANYAAGDTFTVDGVAVTATSPAGSALPAGAFVINQSVIAVLNSSVLTLFVGGGASTVDAEDVDYDNSVSGLTATDVQAAIDELKADIPVIPATYDADDIVYDNTVSGLTATDVQAALDEIVTLVHPQYSSLGLGTAAGVSITEGGYYVKNGICYVDITITNSNTLSANAGAVTGFPPATVVGAMAAMNGLYMTQESGPTDAYLRTVASTSPSTRRYIVEYNTTA